MEPIPAVGGPGAEPGAFGLLAVGAADDPIGALWEHAPVGLVHVGADLRYRRVNAAALAMSGGTLAERLGRTLEEVHGPVGRGIADLVRGVLDGGPPVVDLAFTGRLWHGLGPHQDWRLHVYPVHSSNGDPAGVGIVVTDVTALERGRRQLADVAAVRELALNRYQSLAEAASAAVWTRTADGRAVVDAPLLRAVTGQDASSYRGWGFLDAVHPGDRDRVRGSWRGAVTAADPAVFTCDYRLRTVGQGHRWFRTRAVPVRVGREVVEWIGTETDVHDQVRDRHRGDLLAAATYAMAEHRDPDGEYVALAEAIVPTLADMCRVFVIDPERRGERSGRVTGVRALTRTVIEVPADAADSTRFVFDDGNVVARCVRSAQPELVDLASPDGTDGGHGLPLTTASPGRREWMAQHRVNSMILVPVVANDTVVAVLMLLSCGDRPRFDPDDLVLVAELGRRASSAVQTAVEFERNREVSLALQSAMLTDPPEYPGVEIAAVYQPGGAGLQVGGDWYDAFVLPGGDLAVGVGDVVGHDLQAATTMGQLRSMLRGLAHSSDAGPSEVLRRLDRVVCGLDVTRLTTLIYGRITVTGDGAVFRWSAAGHPAPAIIHADGRVEVLDRPADLVLGVRPESRRRDHLVTLPAGATLVLCTDGLFELRRDTGDDGTAGLVALLTGGVGMAPDRLCRHLVAASTADTGDDMAVLAVRVR